MRHSAKLAAAAMSSCMQQSHAGVHEHQLAADFEYRCKADGAQRMAYPPVVAGGPDACTIHYSRNDKVGRQPGRQAGLRLIVFELLGTMTAALKAACRAALCCRTPVSTVPVPLPLLCAALAVLCSLWLVTRWYCWMAAASITGTAATSPAPGPWAANIGEVDAQARGNMNCGCLQQFNPAQLRVLLLLLLAPCTACALLLCADRAPTPWFRPTAVPPLPAAARSVLSMRRCLRCTAAAWRLAGLAPPCASCITSQSACWQTPWRRQASSRCLHASAPVCPCCPYLTIPTPAVVGYVQAQ